MREEILAKPHTLKVTKIALRPEAQKKVLQEFSSYDMVSSGIHEMCQVTFHQAMEEIKANSGNEGVSLKSQWH